MWGCALCQVIRDLVVLAQNVPESYLHIVITFVGGDELIQPNEQVQVGRLLILAGAHFVVLVIPS